MSDKKLGIKETAAELDRHPNSVKTLIRKGPPEGLDAERKGERKYEIKLSEVERFKKFWKDKTRE